MLIAIVLLVIGFVLLIGGAEALVRGASSLAKNFGVAPLVIGLTVVAFGTSAPEFIVNVIASYKGSSDIGLGNIIGSNISNILLILGVGATITPLKIQKGTVWREIPFAFLAVCLIVIMGNDYILVGETPNQISQGDGLILLLFFILFMYYIFIISRSKKENHTRIISYPTSVSILLSVAGIIGLAAGGHLLVTNAITIASKLGVSETLIGLTVVAVGTSLPELATVVVASLKNQIDLGVGNIIGSNIFNVLWIVGSTSLISPSIVSSNLQADILFSVIATSLLFIVMFVGQRNVLQRYQGVMFIALYFSYVGFLVSRG